jgi:hypothetical protein
MSELQTISEAMGLDLKEGEEVYIYIGFPFKFGEVWNQAEIRISGKNEFDFRINNANIEITHYQLYVMKI